MARQIVVIGGGPAGIEAARAAAEAGATVTLVSEGPLGGRAGWDSLIPSKVWLSTADLLGELRAADILGLAGLPTPIVDPAAILARVKAVAEGWSAQETRRLAALGVRIVTGVASFAAPSAVDIQGDGAAPVRLEGDAFLIAAGSVPRFPPAMKPDGARVLAPRHMSKLGQLPPAIVVVGGGATGSEFTYLFSRLGVKVTWLVSPKGVLPMLAPAAGQHLARALANEGVTIHTSARAERIEPTDGGVIVVTGDGARYSAAMAFLAVGRTPDMARLNLQAAGLAPGPAGTLATDGYGRASETIYAVGDAAGDPMLANRAMAQAWVAGRHAAGARVAPFNPDTVIHAVYTEPQVAQVGVVSGPPETLSTVRAPYSAGLKAHLLPGGEGFVDLAYDPRDRQVRGAVAAGPHAADVLAPVALALQTRATLADLAATFGANPAVSELAFIAARAAECGFLS